MSLSINVVNPSKKGVLTSTVYHLWYDSDGITATLFDNDMSAPILYGNKMLVLSTLRKINTLMVIGSPDTIIYVFSYVNTDQGYKRVQTYHGPISTISKYVLLV